MNITHVVENLNRGGLERMLLELVKIQQRQGHRCQVVCLFEPGALAHELDDLGIPVRACGKRAGLDLRALARARRWVRAHRTELLHTHNAVAHYQTVLATVGLRLPNLINTRHGMGGNRRSGRLEWLYRHALRHTRTVVMVCDAARRDAIRRGIVPAAKAAVVPNGIRVQAFQPTSAGMRERLRRSLQLAQGTRIIGSVGRLNWAKDQRSMLRAFGRVHAQCRDTALVLIGDGELREELQQLAQAGGIADSVHFLGDRSDVHDLLQGFDLFVLSSLSEGYSMALLEACAVALPIVATDVGGTGEIVRDGVSGLLVPAGNPDALAAALLALLQAPEHAAALGAAARAWVEVHGSLETMASRYADIYRQPAA